MTLTKQQLWIATKIDTRMQKLIRAGVPQASREVVLPVLEGMAQRIAALEARIHTS